MKKLIIISMLVASTFASVGVASASNSALIGNAPGWQVDAFNSGGS